MTSVLNAASPTDVAASFSPTVHVIRHHRRSRDGTLFAGMPAAIAVCRGEVSKTGDDSGAPAIFRLRNGLYRLGQSERRRVFNARIVADSDRVPKSKRQLRWPIYLTLGSRTPATSTTPSSFTARPKVFSKRLQRLPIS